MIGIPEAFVRGTVEREGAAGAAWAAELPTRVGALLERWECVPAGEPDHGGVGIVLPVRRRGGGDAVLKVSFPHPGNVHEPDAFTVWDGRGAVRLYARADADFAMLLERVEATTLGEAEDGDAVARVAGAVCRRLAVPAPRGLPRLRDLAGGWEAGLRRDFEELGRPLPGRTVAAAVATVRELTVDGPDLMIHGDLHGRNILRARREPWLAVDPKGLAGDPAYDGGTFLKTRAPVLIAAGDVRAGLERALDVFTEASGLDRGRVRRWAQFQAVQAAFWGRLHGFRRSRGGSERDGLVAFADGMAEHLADGV
ncbi:aminoglycoside phosphotransferase family protein [Streptomyces sp. NPDC057682]|uniref:aminoglycoside phosphotransferase family protein n=1 Tax=Streptomyces sp. NPDC057682 TaxID=3346210 RepID=UPI0036AB4216